jgi:undecaprenyl-diphosphatase
MITYFQAIIIGLFQGITELFPISSLGHSVLLAWLFNWNSISAGETQKGSFFLSFLVILHVATALALLIFYRDTWGRVIKGFFKSVADRSIDTPDGKLAWLLIVATVPAAMVGLLFQNALRSQFAKPLSAVVFLFINGCILLIGDQYQRKHDKKSSSRDHDVVETTENVSQTITMRRSVIIGTAQVGALFAGISRSGITMVSGLLSGLDHEDSARFAFLLATPIIFGAGLVELPTFFSHLEARMRGEMLVGAIAAGIAAYISVKFLDKYFQNKTLRPFGIYCICASVLFLAIGLFRGNF